MPRTCIILALCAARSAPVQLLFSTQHASHLHHSRSLCRKSSYLHHSRSVCSTPRTCPFLAPSAVRFELALFSLCVQQASHLYHSRSVYSTPRICTILALSAARLAPALLSLSVQHASHLQHFRSVQHASLLNLSRSLCSTPRTLLALCAARFALPAVSPSIFMTGSQTQIALRLASPE